MQSAAPRQYSAVKRRMEQAKKCERQMIRESIASVHGTAMAVDAPTLAWATGYLDEQTFAHFPSSTNGNTSSIDKYTASIAARRDYCRVVVYGLPPRDDSEHFFSHHYSQDIELPKWFGKNESIYVSKTSFSCFNNNNDKDTNKHTKTKQASLLSLLSSLL